MIRGLLRALGLFKSAHRCADGPMAGQELVLSEHSRNTAWVVINGEIGRYVLSRGALRWEQSPTA